MARQLVTPNFGVTEIAGWCLRFSDKVFGSKAVYPTAWSAWTGAKFKHEDRDFPPGLAVPVWFDWWGDVGNGIKQYGHVAVRAADGKIWSSPLSGTGSAWFATVDDLVKSFGNGMKYVGWSEDISNVKVIELGEDMATPKQIDLAFQAAFNTRPTEKEIAEFQGRSVDELLEHTLKYSIDLRTKAANFDLFVDALRRAETEVERLRLVERTLAGKDTIMSKEAVIDYITKNLN